MKQFDQLVESVETLLKEDEQGSVAEPITNAPENFSDTTSSELPKLTTEKEVMLVRLAVKMLFLDKNSSSIQDAVKGLTEEVTVENVREIEDKLNQIDSLTSHPQESFD